MTLIQTIRLLKNIDKQEKAICHAHKKKLIKP